MRKGKVSSFSFFSVGSFWWPLALASNAAGRVVDAFTYYLPALSSRRNGGLCNCCAREGCEAAMPCFAPQVFPTLKTPTPDPRFNNLDTKRFFVGENKNEKMEKIFEGRIRIVCEPDMRIGKRWDHCVRVRPMPSERFQ